MLVRSGVDLECRGWGAGTIEATDGIRRRVKQLLYTSDAEVCGDDSWSGSEMLQ